MNKLIPRRLFSNYTHTDVNQLQRSIELLRERAIADKKELLGEIESVNNQMHCYVQHLTATIMDLTERSVPHRSTHVEPALSVPRRVLRFEKPEISPK